MMLKVECQTLLIWMLCSAAASQDVAVHIFIDDDQWKTNVPRIMPQVLGSFPYECIGNINLCPDGFTISLWYNPDLGDSKLPHYYILSSGGQSALSEGVYIRQNYGQEYEIGVASGAKLWHVTCYLVTGSWTNIALTWKASDGLAVYVDSLLVEQDASGSERVFWMDQYNPFQNLLLGKANDDDSDVEDGHMLIWRVTHVNIKYESNQIGSFIANVSNSLLLSCSQSLPTFSSDVSKLSSSNDVATQSNVSLCRLHCFSLHFNLLMFRNSQLCLCIDRDFYLNWVNENPSLASVKCSGTEPYLIQWVTHVIWNITYPINLAVTIDNPTLKPYVRPNETIVFTLKQLADESVTYYFDFKDGETFVTEDHIVGHSWLNEGSYPVNVTAMTRSMVETLIKDIVITYVAEGMAPQNLVVKSDSSDEPVSSGIVYVLYSSYSAQMENCTLYYGDGNFTSYPLTTEFVFGGTTEHQYTSIGLYDINLECSNNFGVSNKSALAAAINPVHVYENIVFPSSISVPFFGMGDVHVLVDGSEVQSGENNKPGAIQIPEAAFNGVGEHALIVQTSAGIAFYQEICNFVTPIEGLNIIADPLAAVLGQNILFTVSVTSGSALHINVSFGDGVTTLFFVPVPLFPFVLSQNHSFSSLGKYEITVTVTNDVNQMVLSKIISIERPLGNATMYGTNVTSLIQPTIFTFEVDLDKVPAMPVSVVFDYDDGNTSTVMLGSQMPTAGKLQYAYLFGKYGIYRVKAIVKNNISSIALPTVIVQVGENITMVDVYVKDSIVAVNQDVIFTIKCVTGSPVLLEMNMGDGSPTVTASRPSTYSSKDNKVYQRVSGTNGRQKRQISDSGNDLSIVYQYKSSGKFTVKAKVSNMFSNTSTSLCPSILVVSSPSAPTCLLTSIRINNSSSLSNPLMIERSQNLTISTTASLQCSGLGNTKVTSGYTWTAERLTGNGIWRPELQVCASNILTENFIVPKNTLWYGTYRLNVTMVVNTLSSSVSSPVPTLTRSSTMSAFLKVQPSSLVASIANTDEKDFSISSIVIINMAGSNDPDVDPSNKTGMVLWLFCYTTATSAKYQSMSLKQMLSSAREVGASPDGAAHVLHFPSDACFTQLDNIWVLDFEVTFAANQLTTDDSVNFVLFATKDIRISSTLYQFQVWPTNVSASALDSIDDMLKRGNTNAALLVINLVAGSLTTNGDEDQDAKQQRTDLRGKLINCLGKVSDNLHNIDQLGKTTEVMASVTANSDEVTQNAKADASDALGKTASKAIEFADTVSSDKLADITGSLMSGVGNILPFETEDTLNETESNSTIHSRRRRSILSALKKKKTAVNETVSSCCDGLDGLCDWIEPVSCLDEYDRKQTNWTEYDCELKHPDDIKEVMARYNQYLDDLAAADRAVKKNITTNGMGACSSIGGVLLSKQDGGANISVSSPKMNLTVVKLDPNQGSSSSSDYQIPGSAGGCGAMALNSANPYTYSASGNQVNGNVKTLSLTSCSGEPIKVEESSEPFTLWMDGAKEEPVMNKFTIIAGVTEGGINYHRITVVENNTAILAIVQPIEADERYDVFLKYEAFPNETYYDWKGVIPNDGGGENNEYERYTIYPPQNLTSLNGTYRFGIKRNTSSDSMETVGMSDNSSYLMYLFGTACRFWNESTDAWDTTGCSVGPLTTPMKTQCLCTHLTSFGGSFAVPPNTIDFSTVFTTEKFLESIPVFTTVIAIIAVYLLVLVWARRMDKRDIVRWGALPLEDNLPSDSYYYQLSVYTGMRKNAGTASKPSFVLSGDLADSGIRCLADGKHKTLDAGSIRNYILSVDSRLGPLTFLRIWHDNSGSGQKKGWFLDQIQVTDLQTGERFFFVCDRWLAVEEDDGMIERIIPVAGMNDLTQFKQLFSSSVRKKFSNDHMWFSVFSRPTRSSFTRVQRISCCVSLLFLTMITNCMFFKATDPDHATSVHIGPIVITLQQIYISVVCTCIVLPPSVAIVTIFRKARPKPNAIQQENQSNGKKPKGWTDMSGSTLFNKDRRSKLQKLKVAIQNITSAHEKNKYEEGEGGQLDKKTKKKPLTFPWWTIFIAWALVFASVTLSGFFTILYSMQWGRQKSLDWLTTFFLSFFQSVIVVQPIKVLAFAAFLSCILKKPDVEEEDGGPDLNTIKPDEEYVNNSHLDLQDIIRMRQRNQTEMSLPDMDVLKRSRDARLKEMQIEAILKECLIYLFFILVLYFISYQDKDKRSFLFSQNVQNRFFQGKPSFSDIQSYSDIYAWLNQTLIPQLYTNGWYNSQPPQDWRELLQIDDHVTVRIGVARLRQLRIKDNTCKVQKAFRHLITHCRSDYNWMDDDTRSYGTGWTPLDKKNNSKPCPQDTDTNDPWIYHDAIELKSSPYMGKVNSYKGGGYTFNFYRDPGRTLEKLTELETGNWLDVHTRGLFIEFTLYNANINLYGSVIMLLEFLSNGGPVVTQEVKVFRLTSYVGPFGIIVILFQVIYLGFIIYFFVHMVKLLRQQKLQYFKDFWNMLEFSTMIMSIVTVAMYGMKMVFGNVAMNVIKENGSGKFVNFVTIGVWNEMYGFILAIVVFLSTIKFINMLKFNRRLSMLTETVKAATKDLKAFVITFFIYFFAFSQLGYLLFCTQIPSYSSFSGTIEVLFCLILGTPGFSDMQTAQEILGPVFYFLYTWFIIFGMQSMFLCIICEAFQLVRKNLEFQKNDYEVGDYILNKFKGLFGLK